MAKSPKKRSVSTRKPTTAAATKRASAAVAPGALRRRSRKVKRVEGDDGEDNSEAADDTKGILRVTWNGPRIERAIDWPETRLDERRKLFSDSTQDAAGNNRKKQVAKGAKIGIHGKMADYIFSVDPDKAVRDDFARDPQRYARSVDNILIRLRKEYRVINKELGQTGAGLHIEDIESSYTHNYAQDTGKVPGV